MTWPRALAALVVVPSCWLLTEWLRSWQALGGPWAVFGVSQWQHPAVLALAAVGGVWLISFALVLANVAIVLVIEALPRVMPGATWQPGLAALGVAAAVASVGAGPLAFALTPASPAAREVTVAMVQPGIVDDPVERIDASERLTAELSRGGELSGVRPDLIVWGESSIPRRPDRRPRTAPCCRGSRPWPAKTAPDRWSARTPPCPARGTRSGRCSSVPPGSRAPT